MTLYELTYLISPELNEGEIKDFFQKIDSLVSKTGKVTKSESPRKITLVYPIQKKGEAFLATFEFQSLPQEADNLKKELAKEKDILRFLLIKKRGPEKIKKRLRSAPLSVSTKALVSKEEKPKPVKKVELKKIEEKLEEVLKE